MILLIVGKSGSGKTAVMEELITKYGYNRVITCTTRKRRDGETENAYHFMSEEEFRAALSRGEFLEHDIYRGNLYGTLKNEFKDAGPENKKVCVVTPEGAEAIKKEYSDACILYLATDMKDSVVRAIARMPELTPKDLKTIAVCASTDEYLYEGNHYDVVVENPMGTKLWEVARAVRDKHEKWVFHNMMQKTNKELAEGLDLIRSAYIPDLKRCMELLNACIEHISAGRSLHESIQLLFNIGFTEDELVAGFNFTRKDVREAIKAAE